MRRRQPRSMIGRTAGDRRIVRYGRSEEHTSELQSLTNLVCRLLLEKKNIPTPKSLTKPISAPFSITHTQNMSLNQHVTVVVNVFICAYYTMLITSDITAVSFRLLTR